MKEKIINLLGISKRVILCRTNDVSKQYVVMESITKAQEEEIDKFNEDDDLYDKSFPYVSSYGKITSNSVFMYGEINFNNKDDTDIIGKLNFVNPDIGGWIYSNFNFDEGNYTTIDGHPKGYFTWDALKWFMYNYVLLGKPKRIIVYKIPHLNGNR